ncbi:zinc finger BED domain-containing protein RICESLEEPER 2-like [Apium graveolens]|uniref:zinc finger BED domain-containing protein RICESLEEPER 2-like n=1 Tax=Apium graveolens TaxID=4045 RepID=UPI003D7AA9DF
MIQTKRLLRQGCKAYLAYVLDVNKEGPRIEDIPVVCKFLDIFPDELPGLPPDREIEFTIDLAPSTEPVSKAPYQMAPVEMKELAMQLQDLLDIGIIRPSVSQWGAPNVFTFTLDNASANNGLIEVLRSHLNLNDTLLCDGKYLHVLCSAYILNLIVQKGLIVIDECVSNVREIMKYVRASNARMIKFAEFVSELSIDCMKKLSQDISTRWNTTYLMLDGALQYKVTLSQYALVENNLTNLTEDEWVKVHKICKFLKPFYDITVPFSGSEYSTSNLYFHGVYKIQSHITLAMQDESSILHAVAFEMNEKFKKYWEDYIMIYSFSIILDPRYKLKFAEYVFQKLYPKNFIGKVWEVRERFEELYLDY